ncbi:MAG TPA: HAMP domain-containing sensor histidine kinase [Rudaea sp.]|nr:HAMP domain-containing sensor histidine kinase [Rudaea sp.]
MSERAAQAPEPLPGRWRSSAIRLLVIYGAFFLAWSIVLVATINWQTTQYLDRVVGEILEQRVHYLAAVERERLPAMLAATDQLDLRGVMYYGLFDAHGAYVAGNIERPPERLVADGEIRVLPMGVQATSGQRNARALGVALRLESGEELVLARYTSVADRIGAMMRSAFGWALSLLLIPGVIGGFLLSRGPLRRVRGIEAAIAPIMRGNLGVRLPLSARGDEVDMLASIVNRMLDEVERLLGEVKGVTDNIAHDLRTPLTRLRAQLHRLQQRSGTEDARAELVERCIVDADALLDRFRALLRLSELEDLSRHSGFDRVDAGETLKRVHELYAPLAEEKRIAFALETAALPPLDADASLLFEAVSNLVDNAIKFTPAAGRVTLRASAGAAGARIDVLDSGPGIPRAEREAVLKRFYRSRAQGDERAGYGLGLSVVAAIAKLHGYCFEIADNEGGGARMTLYCWPCGQAGARTS